MQHGSVDLVSGNNKPLSIAHMPNATVPSSTASKSTIHKRSASIRSYVTHTSSPASCTQQQQQSDEHIQLEHTYKDVVYVQQPRTLTAREILEMGSTLHTSNRAIGVLRTFLQNKDMYVIYILACCVYMCACLYTYRVFISYYAYTQAFTLCLVIIKFVNMAKK